MFLLTALSVTIFDCKEYNQSDFSIDHLVMSVCGVVSCVLGRVNKGSTEPARESDPRLASQSRKLINQRVLLAKLY